jgi:hypothetical protein
VNSPASAAMPLAFLSLYETQRSRRDGHQQPRELRDFGHIGLGEEDGLLGIEAHGEQVECGIHRQLGKLIAIANRRERVQVRDEVVGFIFVLQVDVLPDRTKVVAPMETPGRLNAAEYTHDEKLCCRKGVCWQNYTAG